jgi:GWxTD domain-containing protein
MGYTFKALVPFESGKVSLFVCKMCKPGLPLSLENAERLCYFVAKKNTMSRTLFLSWLFMVPLCLMAQTENVNYFVDVWRFNHTFSDTPRAQIYVSLDGTSVKYKAGPDDLFRPSAGGTLELYKLVNDDTFKVYLANLNFTLPGGGGLVDTTLESRRISMLNMVELGFMPGKYLLMVEVSDKNNNRSNKTQAIRQFEIQALPKGEFGFSDIKWVSRNNRKGRTLKRSDFLPLVTNDYFFNQDTMRYYQELYNTQDLVEDNFLVRSVIFQGDQRIWTTQTRERKKVTREFNTLWESIYIGKLRSNIYYLQIEILDAVTRRTVHTYRKKFYVDNSRLDADFEASITGGFGTEIFNQYEEKELDYYIQTLMFSATEQERSFARVLETFEQKKNFIYSFFNKRRKRDQQIIALWKGHLAALDYVNKNFESTLRPGWQTDRGRVFLQYKIPNDVERYPGESSIKKK